MEENSFISNVNSLAQNLDTIIEAKSIFDAATLPILQEVADLDLQEVTTDLKKGNYLGNRKIDIDLSLNKLTVDSVVSYSQADIVTVEGIRYAIPFVLGESVLELTSHNDIRNYIINHALWQNIQYTEFTVEEATITTPTIIRFRDADGHSSNVDRVELHVYSGTATNIKPSYFWAQSTSALQTIANRLGDIIALGNDIDNIVVLSQRIDELVLLQDNITPVLEAGTHALSASSSANAAALSAQNAGNSVALAAEQALIASQKAEIVQAFANIEWVGFELNDGELTVKIIDGSASTPVLLDGEFIINYN